MIQGIRVCDFHGHEEGLLSTVPSLPYGIKDTPVKDFHRHGVDLAVLYAVGDPASFGAGDNTWMYMVDHLNRIRDAVHPSFGSVVTNLFEAYQVWESDRTAVMLGLEGADVLGSSLEKLEDLYNLGVRFISPVHFSCNQFGSIGMRLDGTTPEDTGLTDLGKTLLWDAQSLGMVVDVAHASDKTVLDLCYVSTKPLICSHGGLKRSINTPRFLGDAAAEALQNSGGILGLWPCQFGSISLPTIEHAVDMIMDAGKWFSPDQIALGTDVNGAPGYPEGYRGLKDTRKLAQSLSNRGFSRDKLEKFLGSNVIRFLKSYWS